MILLTINDENNSEVNDDRSKKYDDGSLADHPSDAEDRNERKRFANFLRKIKGSDQMKELDFGQDELKPHIEPKKTRREMALKNGTRIYYTGCPLCGRTQPMTNEKSERWDTRLKDEGKGVYNRTLGNFEYDSSKLVQERMGGGRGIGFHKVEDYTMSEVSNLFPGVFGNLKEEVRSLVEDIRAVDPEVDI